MTQAGGMPGAKPNANLFSQIKASIRQPQATFIQGAENQSIRYEEVLTRSAQFANVLVDLGLKPGDRVAVQIDKCIDGLFLYLGCIRAGGVYLPLNTAYLDKELDYFIGDAGPKVIVCRPVAKAALDPIARAHNLAKALSLGDEGGSIIKLADKAPTHFDDVVRTEDDLAAILYTSGTTGRSKGAMLTHHNLASNARTLLDYWRFSDSDVLLHALPIFHTHGLFVAINTVLFAGASMIFQPRFEVNELISALPRASVMMGVPTYYGRMLASGELNRAMFENMRLFISGSAPLSPQTHRDFEAATGHVILERYGMTETNMNTSNPYVGERKPGTIGFALPGVEIRIADQSTGEPVVDGEIGVIEIRGPNVFKGYWQMPEKTAEEFRDDGFFISGDLGERDNDGYISIVGRQKDLIITGGFNVYPAEVENAIDAINGIAEVAVIGAPHADFGEAVTAIIVRKGEHSPDEADIKQQLSQVLAKYKIPKSVVFVDELPTNKMGKIQKNQLRDEYKLIYATPP